MREIIPFKKDILFKTRINEITNITLEHDYKILESMVEGDFILNGTYKMTEASVVNEDFFYKIPFSIAISNKIKRESIELNIKDFNYEIVDSDILRINVDLIMNCEESEEEIDQRVEEEIWKKNEEDEINDIIEEVLEEEKVEIKNEDEEEKLEEEIDNNDNLNKSDDRNIDLDVDTNFDIKINNEKRQEKELVEEKEIASVMDSVKEKNEYVTYKVYFAKENDTYESISSRYNVDIKELVKYNDVDEINIGDKIIIPYMFNE